MSVRNAVSGKRVRRQPLTRRPAWKALKSHYKAISEVHLRQLFADDPRRGERLTAQGAEIYLDYSKNAVTDETMRLLLRWLMNPVFVSASMPCLAAKRSMSPKARSAAYGIAGAGGYSIIVDGVMWYRRFSSAGTDGGIRGQVRSGEWKGHTGKRFAT